MFWLFAFLGFFGCKAGWIGSEVDCDMWTKRTFCFFGWTHCHANLDLSEDKTHRTLFEMRATFHWLKWLLGMNVVVMIPFCWLNSDWSHFSKEQLLRVCNPSVATFVFVQITMNWPGWLFLRHFASKNSSPFYVTFEIETLQKTKQWPASGGIYIPEVQRKYCLIGWWFQIFFMFGPTWGIDPIWLIFFKRVETTS